jgi:hypothetical protein
MGDILQDIRDAMETLKVARRKGPTWYLHPVGYMRILKIMSIVRKLSLDQAECLQFTINDYLYNELFKGGNDGHI